MTPDVALSLFGNALYLCVVMISVIVVPSLAVGLMVSTFQAATQINEQTLSFLPRLLVTLATIMMTGPWIIRKLMELAEGLMISIPDLIG